MLARTKSKLILILGLFLALSTSLAMGGQRFDRESRSRGLLFGWGHSWKAGWPGYGKTESTSVFAAFHPQMGWFVSDHLKLYAEGSLLLYYEPTAEISAGIVGIAGRYHFSNDRVWNPYATLGAGILWTSLLVTAFAHRQTFLLQSDCWFGSLCRPGINQIRNLAS